MNDFSELSIRQFLSTLASSAPTPGGGTAAAIAGAMGAGLAEMVTALTLAREKYAASHDAMRPIARGAAAAREELLALARQDAEAYDEVVAARRLPRDTDEQKSRRDERISAANRRAAEIPLGTARAAWELLQAIPELARKGNPNAASDAGAAALLLEAAVQAALLNVAINLPGVSDEDFVARMRREASRLAADAERLRAEVLEIVRTRS
jgi:formiminotetrahydrofolate cyclodeaminase